MSQDLTIIRLSASQLPEKFDEYGRRVLLEAAGDFPIISVTRKPLDFGHVQLLDEEPKCLSNIYFQLLRAAKEATTEFVATAEDDCCYPKEHFTFFRPKPNEVAYDQNRWGLFMWRPEMYSWRNRVSNCTLIAPRQLLIDSLEERFSKWPKGTPDSATGEVGRRMIEKNLGLTPVSKKEVFCEVSTIMFNHDFGSEERQRTHRKSLGQMKAYSLYHWGRAESLAACVQ